MAVVFACPLAMAAVPEKLKKPTSLSPKSAIQSQQLYEQLAGKPPAGSRAKASKVGNPKVLASATKALTLARQSRTEKNYILAIKRYNFILKYYSKTPQAKIALADKASLYKEMGLSEQAAYNQKRISTMRPIVRKNMTSKATPTPASKATSKPAVKR